MAQYLSHRPCQGAGVSLKAKLGQVHSCSDGSRSQAPWKQGSGIHGLGSTCAKGDRRPQQGETFSVISTTPARTKSSLSFRKDVKSFRPVIRRRILHWRSPTPSSATTTSSLPMNGYAKSTESRVKSTGPPFAPRNKSSQNWTTAQGLHVIYQAIFLSSIATTSVFQTVTTSMYHSCFTNNHFALQLF